MPYFLTISVLSLAIVPLTCLAAFPLYQNLPIAAYIEFSRFAKVLIILAIITSTLLILKQRQLSAIKVFGFTPTRKSPYRLFATSFSSGVVIVLAVAAFFYIAEIRVLDEKYWNGLSILHLCIKYFFTALFIAIIEEAFFRGVLMYDLIKRKQILAAILLPAIVFTLLHFIAISSLPPEPDTVGWYYGWNALLEGIAQKHSLSDALQTASALLVAGIFLGLVRISTKHIIPCIGIHCGWVFGVKMNSKLTDFQPEANFAFLVSDYNRFLGWATAIWFSVLVLAFITWEIQRNKRTNIAT